MSNVDDIQAELSDMPEPAPDAEEQAVVTEAEKVARLEGVSIALRPAMRYPDDLARARAVWYNATATDAPAFLTDDHYLIPHFVESILALRSATSYEDIANVIASLQDEFNPYLTIVEEPTPMDTDVEAAKRSRDSPALTEDLHGGKRSRPDLNESVKPPLRTHDWDEVQEPGDASSTISNSVDDFLDQFEACISGVGGMLHPEAVAHDYFPPDALWTPEPDLSKWTEPQRKRFGKMQIPKVPLRDGAARPDLLLHCLGKLETIDPDAAARLKLLEESSKLCFLNNASGSGKTRLLFELSCKIWTFYFNLAWDPSTNPYGSRDMYDAFQMLIDPRRLGPNGNPFQSVIVDHEPNSPSLQADVNRWFYHWNNNAALAEHLYQLVFLARLLIYQRFRRLAVNLPADKAKRAWCMLQICPQYAGMPLDAFCVLLHRLVQLSKDSAETQIVRLLDELDFAGWFPNAIIFDEAQAAAQKCSTLFGRTLKAEKVNTLGRSHGASSGDRPRLDDYCRPLLKPLVGSICEDFVGPLRLCKTYIAGTKLHRELVSEALSSSVGKDVAFDDFIEFGEQDNPDKIRKVLVHFLGGTVVNRITQSMWEEMNYWLQGRHRFISIFVSGVLMSGRQPEQMMNVLSNMLKKLTGHALLGQKHRDLTFLKVDSIMPRIITDPTSINEGLRNFLSSSILEFIIKGKPLRWADSDQDLVVLGVGRFEAISTKESKSVVVNEHLVLVTLFHWLRGTAKYSPLRSWLDLHMADSQRSTAGFGFEDVTLFLFWDWFAGDGRPLNQIFDFKSSPPPAWASEKAQLISVFRANAPDGNTAIAHKLHTGGLTYAANTAEDTLNWFFGDTRCPILKPDLNFGGDVVFGLRLESGIEILVCVQCKFWSAIHHKGEIEKELWKLSPEGFYKGSVQADLEEKLDEVLQMFRAIQNFVQKPKPGTPSHPDVVKYNRYPPKYRVLRVLAAFSDTIKVPQEIFSTQAIGCYPFALLSSGAMLLGSGHFSSFKRAVEKAEEVEEAARQAEERAAELDAARNAEKIAKDVEKKVRRSDRNKK